MRAFKLLGIGAALVVLAASLWADVALAQDQIAIYRVLPVQVTRDSVLKLAREAFGMDNPEVNETIVGFVVTEGSKSLQVTKASGSILFADDSKLWNPDYRPRLPSEEEAIRLATEFLRKHHLLPPQADPDQTGLPAGAITRGLADIQADNHVEVSYYFFINPGFGSAPFPGNAPGALLQVAVGQGGEIIGLMRRWRDIELAEQRPLLSFTQARELLCWKLQLPTENCTQLFDPGLIYPVWGDLDVQTFVYPLYLFSLGGMGYSVPATNFSVFARIRAPADGAQIPQGTPVEFRAEVRTGFGSAPFSYAWGSTLDGELGQAATFRKVLSPGTHIISLTVADRNGTADVQYISLTVGSPGAAAPVPPDLGTASAASADFRALVGLGMLTMAGALGLIVRRGWSRWGMLLLLFAFTVGLGESAAAQAQRIAGRFFNDGGPDFTGAFELTEHGLRLRDFKWQNFFIARDISIPFVDVELNIGGAAKRVRLKLDPKKAGAIQAKYDLKQLPQPPQGQAAPKLEKVRFAYRLDFDVQGGQNEIPALVRQFIDEFKPQIAAALFGTLGIPIVTPCSPPQQVAAGLKPVNLKGQQAQILCPVAPGPVAGQVLDGQPTQNVYDSYSQAAIAMWIPGCSAPNTPCVHMHLRHLDLGQRVRARGRGLPNWPPEKVEHALHTFTVVEYQGKAGQPREPDPATVDLPPAQLPVDLAQIQLNAGVKVLSNPVLWYAPESMLAQGTFFAYEPIDKTGFAPLWFLPARIPIVQVPLHWVGFSCGILIAPGFLPTC